MTGTNQYIDISWPLSESITAYKDKSVASITAIKQFEHDGVRETLLTLSSHTGTHIDAPAHFVADGITTEAIPLASTIGPCTVLDMTACSERITKADLQAHTEQIIENQIILFKTTNSFCEPTAPFRTDFVYLDKEAALFLREQKIKAVGIDYLGIERNQKNHETHLTLLQAGIIIIEGLRLAHVTPGNYFLYCLPLAFIGIDGAPARAILVKK